ncbi:hypothetical protein DYB32_010859, partial [Aphanomyces invadans]
DNPPNFPRKVRADSASTTASTLSSLSDRSSRTPPRSPSSLRRKSKIGFEDQSTLEKLLEALMTQQQQQQQAFVAHVEKADRAQQSLLEAFMKTATQHYAAPIQPSLMPQYANPYPMAYAASPSQPDSTNYTMNQSKQPAPSRTKPNYAPYVISTKPDDMTTSGVKVCGRCDRAGHGSADCPRKHVRCNLCHEPGHYAGEHPKVCHYCKLPGHTVSRCPSKQAQQA